MLWVRVRAYAFLYAFGLGVRAYAFLYAFGLWLGLMRFFMRFLARVLVRLILFWFDQITGKEKSGVTFGEKHKKRVLRNNKRHKPSS